MQQPQYQLLEYTCAECGAEPVEFIRLCTETRHRTEGDVSPLCAYYARTKGRNWFFDMLDKCDGGVYVVLDDIGTEEEMRLYKNKCLGVHRLKKLAVAYCDWVACLLGSSDRYK